MSLAAALLLGANLYAIDNVKVNGDAKLYYGTSDNDVTNKTPGLEVPDMFDKDVSYADAGIDLGITADLTEGVSAGVSMQAVSTLGLENNLVSGVWSGAHDVTTGNGASFDPLNTNGVQVDDAAWVSEAWIAGTAYDTTAKIGRMTLDTPLAFTETWSISTNTFEGAVLLNQSIEDTTLVGAWIGKSNGIGDDTAALNLGNVVSVEGKFNTFAKNGAYAVGAINNSWKPLTAQAWYYNLEGLANAYWVQADLDMEGILAGAQVVGIDANDNVSPVDNADKDAAFGLMLGYAMKDVVTVKVAYSKVDDDGTLGVGNVATRGAGSGSQSKLYTEMWWWYGTVSQTGAESWAVTAEATPFWDVDLFLGYYYSEIDANQIAGVPVVGNDTNEVSEIAFTASRSFGPLDASVAILYDDFDQDAPKGANYLESQTNLQVYLTYNF